MDADAGAAYTIEDFNRMAQMINYDNHRGMFEALSVRRSNGLLMWMSQSSWPSFMWQTYDWYLDTNGGYFGAKAGNQPTHAVWDPRDNSIVLHNATPHVYENINTTVTLYDLYGKPVSCRDYTSAVLESDACGIQVARAEFSASPTDMVFIRLIVRDASGGILGESFYWHNRKVYQDYREMSRLPKAELSASVTGRGRAANGKTLYRLALTNGTGTPAIQNRIRTLDAEGEDILPVFYSDNYFALMPGESKTVTAEFDNAHCAGGEPGFVLTGWNTVEKSFG
jgi:hypothetical protein